MKAFHLIPLLGVIAMTGASAQLASDQPAPLRPGSTAAALPSPSEVASQLPSAQPVPNAGAKRTAVTTATATLASAQSVASIDRDRKPVVSAPKSQ